MRQRRLEPWPLGLRELLELFAVMRPANERAEKIAQRLGMQWVGETDKYGDLRLPVYRLRPTDPVDGGGT